MSFKTTIKLLMIVVALLIMVWGADRRLDSVDQKRKKIGVVFKERGVASELTIQAENYTVVMVRKDGKWIMTSPVQGRASEGEVERIMSVVQSLRTVEIITSQQRRARDLKLDDYGLAVPRYVIVFSNAVGRFRLDVGADAPVGNLVYVRRENSDDVLAVDRSLEDAIPGRLEVLRDRLVFSGETMRTVRMTIHDPRGGYIHLMRNGAQWWLQQPVQGRADTERVNGVLDLLYALEVRRFVWDRGVGGNPSAAAALPSSSDVSVMESYGLASDETTVRVAVWNSDNQSGDELVLGKPADEKGETVYARLRDGDSVFTVDKMVMDACSLTVSRLRDSRLFAWTPRDIRYIALQDQDRKITMEWHNPDGWTIMEPLHAYADQAVVMAWLAKALALHADTFVEPAPADLTALGLQPPQRLLQFSISRPEEDWVKGNNLADGPPLAKVDPSLVHRVRFGSKTDDPSKQYGYLDDESAVFTIRAADMAALDNAWTNPLVFHERTVVAVASDHIRRVTWSRQGREAIMTRTDGGVWQTAATNVVVLPEVASDVLSLVSDFVALHVEKLPERPASYGLDDRSLTRLTFEFDVPETPPVTLSVGVPKKQGDAYVVVQGKDIMFVVERDKAVRLVQEWLGNVSDLAKEERPR